MHPRSAIQLARDAELDLVEVAPMADPPVCRIMNFGKYKFQQSKKAQSAKRKQKVIHVKEVKLRPKTDEHDYQFKIRNAGRFISQGNKVKITIMFRGREMAHTDIGRRIIDRVILDLAEIAVVEQTHRLEGRHMNAILAPKK